MASLPAGSVLDSLGPTRTSIIGASLFGLGNLFFAAGAISRPIGVDLQSIGSHNILTNCSPCIAIDGIFIGFVLLALGSPLIFLSSFHVSNAFPHRSGLILSTIMAAFNASSTPYAIYNWADRRYDLSPRTPHISNVVTQNGRNLPQNILWVLRHNPSTVRLNPITQMCQLIMLLLLDSLHCKA